jgi:glycosyltransferase involved in cell wall biosynthesis
MNTTSDFSSYKDNFVTVHSGPDQPEISIVMPIYNCEKFVADAVTSVLNQQGVVAEILISDDASTDGTFDVAYQTVIDYISQTGSKHTVRMRAGSSRLVRDHLHLMVKTAGCDLLCQAHGDDISHPLRCRILVKTFDQKDKNISMIFVNPSLINQHGKTSGEPNNFSLSDIRVEPVKYDDVIWDRTDCLIGGNMAWRQSLINVFPQLTTSYCTYGHDRVMAFRSFLIGGCYILDAPLVQRRLHKNQLHRELLSFEHNTVNFFNFQLIRLSIFSAMKNDLIFLKENNLIKEADFIQYAGENDNVILQVAKLLANITGNLVIDGYVNQWVKPSEIPEQ